MKKLFTILLLSFGLLTAKAQNNAIVQAVLNNPELVQHFSYLPRFQETGHDYYFMVKNKWVGNDWHLSVNQEPVRILSSHDLDERKLNYFMEITNLKVKHGDATVDLIHKYHKLEAEENKEIHVHASLEKKGDSWEVTKLKIDKVNISAG